MPVYIFHQRDSTDGSDESGCNQDGIWIHPITAIIHHPAHKGAQKPHPQHERDVHGRVIAVKVDANYEGHRRKQDVKLAGSATEHQAVVAAMKVKIATVGRKFEFAAAGSSIGSIAIPGKTFVMQPLFVTG